MGSSAILNNLDYQGEASIISRIESGESQADIARSFKIQPSQLTYWINSDSERLARAREARVRSAESWMDKAEQVLQDIPSAGTQADITRAKELALHYRKMAMIRNPREYGDKIDISGSVEHKHSVAPCDLSAWANRSAIEVTYSQVIEIPHETE